VCELEKQREKQRERGRERGGEEQDAKKIIWQKYLVIEEKRKSLLTSG
jgi:hypothetical protein